MCMSGPAEIVSDVYTKVFKGWNFLEYFIVQSQDWDLHRVFPQLWNNKMLTFAGIES